MSVLAAVPAQCVDWAHALEHVLRDPALPALAAQPIVDTAESRIAGYELLSRFPRPSEDARFPDAPPDVWFAHAETHGLAGELTARVVSRAIELRESLQQDRFLTVNVEPHLLVQPSVQRALASGGGLARIVVELTEHTSPEQVRGLDTALARIRSAGGLVAVDDAGTGYAGLTQLLAVRPDIIKLDRELVTDLHRDPVRRALASMLGDLAGRMDAWLLAEGVETADELGVLAELGVPLVQGWLLARPAPPWTELAPDAVGVLRSSAARASLAGHVAPLVRSCGTARLDTVTFADQRREDVLPPAYTVVTDDDDVAQSLCVRGVDGHAVLAPLLLVAPSTSTVEAARRAMARSREHRGIPLVCTDGRGQVLGLVDVADLVEALIDHD